MSTIRYSLVSKIITPVSSIAPEPTVTLEQRMFSRLQRSGLMLGVQYEGDSIKITPVGLITRNAATRFKEFVVTLFESGHYQIKVDLSQVKQIDGHGLAVLTWMTVRANEREGQVTISNPLPQVRRLMLAVQAHFMLEVSDYELVAS